MRILGNRFLGLTPQATCCRPFGPENLERRTLMPPNPQVLEVWGDFACFSRPELKVERFSYPVITPSAARGIFDAVYAKPAEFRWAVTAIEVLAQPSYVAL